MTTIAPPVATGLLTAGTMACLASLLLTPAVRSGARRLGAVARGGHRHVHFGEVPTLGGLAIAAAVGIGIGIPHWFAQPLAVETVASGAWPFSWIGAGTLLILGAGIADDVAELPIAAKLTAQIAAAGAVLAGGLSVPAITNPLGDGVLTLGWLGPLATLFWVVALTDAFNLIAGLDALAPGVGLVACATTMMIAFLEGRGDVMLLTAALGGALLGFLAYNFHPASIFLGDTGSMLIGYWLAVLSLGGRQKGATAIVVLVPLLTLGLPILDMVVSVARRSVETGWASIVRADREHIHHRLLALGLDQRRAVLVLYAVATLFGVAALLCVFAHGWQKALLVVTVGAATFIGIRVLAHQ